jgi:hypothetical protein
MAGQLRVDEITNEAGTGSPSFPQGIAPSSLGSGTPSASNFLRGDGSWQPVDVEGEIADFAAGEPGQPRLVGNAVSLFPGTYPVITGVTASNAFSVENGLTVSQSSSGFTNSTTFIDAVRIIVTKYSGTIRFRTTVSNELFTGDADYQAEVRKNDTLVQTFTGTLFSNSSAGLTADISIAPDDEILWRIRRTSGARVELVIGSNTASNGYITAGLFRPAV